MTLRVRAAVAVAALLSFGCEPAKREPAAAPSSASPAAPLESRLGDPPPSREPFRPPTRRAGDRVVMPVTFVDGTTAEIVADASLRVQDMWVQVFAAGGLGAMDRTLDFRFGDGAAFMHEGPLDSYEGPDGSVVELWKPMPDFPAPCPFLVYRFDEWFVGVRTCQDRLSGRERERWARLLRGTVTPEGWLVLDPREPLVLARAGWHSGPEVLLGRGRSNWIEVEPGHCDPADVPDEGDVRAMPDGTVVSFSQVRNGAGRRTDDWSAIWCEDGAATIQVSQAYGGFAEAAAAGFRLRDVRLVGQRRR